VKGILRCNQTEKGDQRYFGMKVHKGVEKDSGLIYSVETTSANLYDITRAAPGLIQSLVMA
jgi:IS5 family transposase